VTPPPVEGDRERRSASEPLKAHVAFDPLVGRVGGESPGGETPVAAFDGERTVVR
jgi:hypothetical protein